MKKIKKLDKIRATMSISSDLAIDLFENDQSKDMFVELVIEMFNKSINEQLKLKKRRISKKKGNVGTISIELKTAKK